MGGLGNQLFQYALGRRLAIERKVPLKLDLRWYTTQNKRKFELDHFTITADVATEEEIYKTRYLSHNRYILKASSVFQNILPYWKQRFIKEKTDGAFDPRIILAPKSCVLQGYWQSEDYFSSIAGTIRKELIPKNPISCESIAMAKEMRTRNSVSVHIRRGDYVTESDVNKFHGVLDIDYYLTAITRIQSQTSSPHFYLFSDDLHWVKENLRFVSPCTFVEGKAEISDHEQIWLMSRCKHHIIANSSFSWWGAWLGINPNKLVIAPKKWFSNPTRITDDLTPDKWIRL